MRLKGRNKSPGHAALTSCEKTFATGRSTRIPLVSSLAYLPLPLTGRGLHSGVESSLMWSTSNQRCFFLQKDFLIFAALRSYFRLAYSEQDGGGNAATSRDARWWSWIHQVSWVSWGNNWKCPRDKYPFFFTTRFLFLVPTNSNAQNLGRLGMIANPGQYQCVAK